MEICENCYWSKIRVEADRGKIYICENTNGLNRDVNDDDYCSEWEERE